MASTRTPTLETALRPNNSLSGTPTNNNSTRPSKTDLHRLQIMVTLPSIPPTHRNPKDYTEHRLSQTTLNIPTKMHNIRTRTTNNPRCRPLRQSVEQDP